MKAVSKKGFSIVLTLAFLIMCTIPFSASATGISIGETKLEYSRIDKLPDGGNIYVYEIDGVEHWLPVPPDGFSPIKATDEQLEQYGFPARPTKKSDLADWTEMMSSYKKTATPSLTKTNRIHSTGQKVKNVTGNAIGNVNATRGYYNWSGYVMNGSFNSVSCDFRQPTIQSGATSNTYESTWIGLGGADTPRLTQCGTAMNTANGGRNYYAWYEYLGNGVGVPEIRLNNITVRANDRIHCYLSFQKSNNKLNCYIANNTNGTSQTILISLSSATYFDGSTADFINEHPSVGDTDNGLCNYGTTNWTSCKAYTMSGSWVNLSAGSPDKCIMYSSDLKRILSEPGSISSGTNFPCYWRNYR